MTESTVTVNRTVDNAVLIAAFNDAPAGISYWASNFTWSNGGFALADSEGDGKRYRVTWQRTWESLALMASGFYTNHAGDNVKLAGYHVLAATSMIFDPEDADYDSDTLDTLIQLATFGRVIYG